MLLEMNSDVQIAERAVAGHNLAAVRAEAIHVKSGINPYQIKVTEQTIEKLKEKLQFCRSETSRSRELLQSRATSPQEHEAIETRMRQTMVELKEKEAELVYLKNFVTPELGAMMDAKVRHAQSALERAEERLRETFLLAPFDGVVLKVLKKEGEGVRSSEPEPVILFGDLSKLMVRAEIDERFVTSLTVGQKCEIYGRNLAGRTFRGNIVELEPIMGDKTVFSRMSSDRKDLDVVQVLIELDPPFAAPVGLQVDVRIEWPSNNLRDNKLRRQAR
jgi:HlyD family secretion protein